MCRDKNPGSYFKGQGHLTFDLNYQKQLPFHFPMVFQQGLSNKCEYIRNRLNVTYYFKRFSGECRFPKPNQLGSPNIVCEWYLGMPAECSLLFIGQCDFDLCVLDTILHWGHLSLYCDPALVHFCVLMRCDGAWHPCHVSATRVCNTFITSDLFTCTTV